MLFRRFVIAFLQSHVLAKCIAFQQFFRNRWLAVRFMEYSPFFFDEFIVCVRLSLSHSLFSIPLGYFTVFGMKEVVEKKNYNVYIFVWNYDIMDIVPGSEKGMRVVRRIKNLPSLLWPRLKCENKNVIEISMMKVFALCM